MSETVNISEKAQATAQRLFPEGGLSLGATDPEFIERHANFAFDEVMNHGDMDDRTRFLAILATLIGCQGVDLFEEMVPAAMNAGLTPVEIKEVVYQAVAYCGIGRVYPFIKAANALFADKGIDLPLPPQATTTVETRMEAGIQAQVDIFGEGMRHFTESGPEETRHING